MLKAIKATHQTFESSCFRTPEYLAWHRLFKRELTAYLVSKGASDVQFSKPNHFDASGFFTLKGGAFYFSLSDLRWFKDMLLMRTASCYGDYTGGVNRYLSLETFARFDRDFDTTFGGVANTADTLR